MQVPASISPRFSSTTNGLNLSFTYDLAGNRASMTWPDGGAVTYTFDGNNEMVWVGNAAVGMGYGLDDLGRIGLLERHATTSPVAWDNADRMTSLAHNLAGGAVTYSLGYTPADQVTSAGISNPVYQWAAPSGATNNSADGLYRDAAIAALSGGYDANGNLINDGARTFTYDLGNRLTSANGGRTSVALAYDPLDRLEQTVINGAATLYLWDGDDLVAEYGGAGLSSRFVHGPGEDNPVIWFAGSGMAAANASYLIADHQGSIIATTDTAGNSTNTFTYDPYGAPNSWAVPTFGYTGQIALPGSGLWYYRARVYDPVKGHFLQTDPVGYGPDLDLYAYVGEDPTDREDPSGLDPVETIGYAALYLDATGNHAAAQQQRQLAQGVGSQLARVVAKDPVGLFNLVVGALTADPWEAGAGGVGLIKSISEDPVARGANDDGVENAGVLPKPPTGPGTVPKAERDPKRTWTPAERATKREAQGGECGNGCGTSIDASNSQAHHIRRHADGGRTDDPNHAEVCIPCHRDLHSPNEP